MAPGERADKKMLGTMAYWLKKEVGPPHSVVSFFFFCRQNRAKKNDRMINSECRWWSSFLFFFFKKKRQILKCSVKMLRVEPQQKRARVS